MPVYCTIYCTEGDVPTIQAVIEHCFPGSKAKATSRNNSQITLKGQGGGTLKLTFMRYRKRGDAFCGLQLSTSNFVRNRTKGQAKIREALGRKFQACGVIIGVVAEPDFEGDERFTELCYTLAANLDGVMFDGSDFFDAEGKVLARAKE